MPTSPIDYAIDGNMAAPAVDGVSITPADSNLAQAIRGFWCNAAGTVAIITPRGSTLAFTVLAGSFVPYWAIQVKATGTSLTAGQIIGAY